VPVGLIADG